MPLDPEQNRAASEILRFHFFSKEFVVRTPTPRETGRFLRLYFNAEPERDADEGGRPMLDIAAGCGEPADASDLDVLPVSNTHLYFDPRTESAFCPLVGRKLSRGARAATLEAVSYYVWMRLKRDGLLFYHASAVLYGGTAILFAGDNRAGKSSLMRKMVLAGHPYLADDNIALELRGGDVVAHPTGQAVDLSELSTAERKRFRDVGFTRAPGRMLFFPPRDSLTPLSISTVFLTQLGDAEDIRHCNAEADPMRLASMNRTPLFSPDDFRAADSLYTALARRAHCMSLVQSRGKPFPLELIADKL